MGAIQALDIFQPNLCEVIMKNKNLRINSGTGYVEGFSLVKSDFPGVPELSFPGDRGMGSIKNILADEFYGFPVHINGVVSSQKS